MMNYLILIGKGQIQWRLDILRSGEKKIFLSDQPKTGYGLTKIAINKVCSVAVGVVLSELILKFYSPNGVS